MQKSKLCNFQIKNKKNFSFTKYSEKDGDSQIIKYEENNGTFSLKQYDDSKK